MLELRILPLKLKLKIALTKMLIAIIKKVIEELCVHSDSSFCEAFLYEAFWYETLPD